MISTVFNDLASIGSIALKVNTHLLMQNYIEVVAVPTSIFSSHMGHKEYVKYRTAGFSEIVDSIEKIYKSVDGVLVGYVDDEKVRERISCYIKNIRPKVFLLDPILGDDGKLYSGSTFSQIKIYKKLLKEADIITPNITEALCLTGRDVRVENKITLKEVEAVAKELHDLGAKEVIIKSIIRNDKLYNLYFDGQASHFIETDYVGRKFHGTGDIYASLVLALKLKKMMTIEMLEKLQRVIEKNLKNSKSDEILMNISLDNW